MTARWNEFGSAAVIVALVASFTTRDIRQPDSASRPRDSIREHAPQEKDPPSAGDGSLNECENRRFSPQDVVVIATLPDPVTTRLSVSFDRNIDAIHAAFQQAGYNLQNADFRWTRASSAAPPPSSSCPGLISFASSPSAASVHTPNAHVLVVGESPTAGVNEAQFRLAVKSAVFRQGKDAAEKMDRVYVLGPSFSGTLSTLPRILQSVSGATWECKQPRLPIPSRFIFHSGSVTSETAISRFKNAGRRSGYELEVLQHTDEYQIGQFFSFLEQRGLLARVGSRDPCSGPRVALVSEDGTAYGAPVTNAEGHSKCLLQFYFPREIYHLRTAYLTSPKTTANPVPSSRTFRLEMENEDGASSNDVVPTFSRKHTSLSKEAVLLELAAMLRVHGAEYVLVRATDPLDMLFIAQFLRRNFPEAQIVTLTNDLLFRRESDLSDLYGIMAVSSYPLIPSSSRFVGEADGQSLALRAFPNGTSAGVFNATLSLLETIGLITKGNNLPPPYHAYSAPSLEPDAPHRDADVRSSAPAVWLTAIGRDGYWPVAALGFAPGESGDPLIRKLGARVPKHHKQHVPVGWLLIWTSLTLAALWLTVSAWTGSSSRLTMVDQRLAAVEGERSAALLVSLSLALMFAMLVSAVPLAVRRPEHSTIAFLLAAGPAAVLGISMTLHLWLLRCCRRAAVIHLFAVCAMFLIAHHVHNSLQAPSEFFTVYRALHISSGLSAALPLFLLASGVFCWAWYALAGETVVGSRKIILPRQVSNLPAHDEFKDLDRTTKREWIACCVVGLVSGMLLFRSAFRTLEPSLYTNFFLSSLVGLSLLMTHTLFRIWDVWHACSNLLGRLDSSPLRDAFARIHGFSWTPIWELTSSDPRRSFRALGRAFLSLRNLMNCLREPDQAIAPVVDALQNAFNRANVTRNQLLTAVDPDSDDFHHPLYWLLSHRRRERAIRTKLREYQAAQAAAAAVVYECIILPRWKSQAAPVAVSPPTNIDGHPQCVTVAEEFVALVYVHAITRILLYVRWQVMAVGGLFALALLAFTVYPFAPRSLITTFFSIVFIAAGYVVVHVYADMHRDHILSLLTDTTSGKLGGDFWLRVLSAGAAPVITLVSAQIPELNRLLGTWFKPLLDKFS